MTQSLVVEDLKTSYKSGFELQVESLRLEQGLTVVLGLNGSGKSTLLRAVANQSASVGLLPQRLAVPEGMRVSDYIELARVARLGLFESIGASRIERVEQTAALCGCKDLLDRRVEELSGGQLKRVALARSLFAETDVLLLDEPLSDLDIRAQAEISELIAKLATDKCVLAVVHDLRFAVELADRILVMDNGKLVSDRTVQDTLDAGVLEELFGPLRL